MNTLRIPLTGIGEAGVRVDTAAEVETLRPADAAPLPLGAARLTGVLSRIDTEYLFRGRIVGAYERPCDRCLRGVSQPIDLEVTWFFEEDGGDIALQDGEKRGFVGQEIDLAPYLWEELVLAMPVRCVCEDAAGCVPEDAFDAPERGGEGDEDVGAPMNEGLAKLKDLFPGLDRDVPETKKE